MGTTNDKRYTREEVKHLIFNIINENDDDDDYLRIGKTFNDPVEYHHYAGLFHDEEHKKRVPGDREGLKHKKAGLLHHNAFDAAWIYQEGIKNNVKPSQTLKNLRKYKKAYNRAEEASRRVWEHHNYRLI